MGTETSCVKGEGFALVARTATPYLSAVMAQQSFFQRLIPLRFRKSVPVVTHVRLQGAIGVGTPMRPPLTFKDVEPQLERAFRKGVAAVAITVNSPGGSPVQSALIHDRIRALAAEFKLPVYVFCEDVAASGGYWLACAGDEIYADGNSVVGSIGVISAGFGFVETIRKLGVERRVYASGENKAVLDPFQPEKPEDVARLKDLQADVHEFLQGPGAAPPRRQAEGGGPRSFHRCLLDRAAGAGAGPDRRTGPPARDPPSEIRRKACYQSGFGTERLGFAASRIGFGRRNSGIIHCDTGNTCIMVPFRHMIVRVKDQRRFEWFF